MGSFENVLDRLHERLVRNRWLVLFTATTRALLALAFVPSGYVKATGQRFTTLSPDDPVGAFFDHFFHMQGFYQFVGWAQLVAALLLLFPTTAPLGTVVYFPIALNIFVITVAVGFGLTTAIAAMMTLGCLYLLCWHYDRWKGLLPGFTPHSTAVPAREPALLTFILTIAAGVGFLGVTGLHLARLRNASMYVPACLVVIGAIVALGSAWTHLRRPARQDAVRVPAAN